MVGFVMSNMERPSHHILPVIPPPPPMDFSEMLQFEDKISFFYKILG